MVRQNLPNDYTELTYIESTGTQYIDTGFIATNNTRIIMNFEITANQSSIHALFGARNSGATRCYVFLWTGSRFRSYYNEKYNDIGKSDATNRRTVDQNKETTYFDGETVVYENVSFTTPNSVYLLASCNGGKLNWASYAKLYSCKIYDNGTLVRGYIPVKNKYGEVGLYDFVNDVFYKNQGTGSFVAGAEIPRDDEEEQIKPANPNSIYKYRMHNYYPAVIQSIKEFNAIIDSEYPEFDEMNVGELINDAYFLTLSGTRISQWEQVLGIAPLPDSTIQDRRDTIIARIRAQGKLNTATINAIVNAFTGGSAESWVENSTLYVEITPPPGNKVYKFENVERELSHKIPAHLGLNITRNYATWDDIYKDFDTWQDVLDYFDSWEDVVIYVKRN